MNAQLIQIQGLTFAAKGDSNHWVILDGPEKFGGSDGAARSMELVLFGFAGCAGADVASILEKMRTKLDTFEIHVQAERAEEHPKVFTRIHLSFLFRGKELESKQIERAIELTRTKYCPVWAILKETVEITYSYDIQVSE